MLYHWLFRGQFIAKACFVCLWMDNLGYLKEFGTVCLIRPPSLWDLLTLKSAIGP